MNLNIILLEASLELVPKEIINHPAVVKNAKRRGKKPEETLLDISLHYHAMKNLKDNYKRGRPDIVHQALLVMLTDPTIKGNFFIHTVQSKIIRVNPNMRPPKNYMRFIGLMEQLLKYGKIPINGGETLMEVTNLTLEDVLSKYNLILLSEKGEKISPEEICRSNENLIIGIGAFPHGDFSEKILKLAKKIYSISKFPLETQQVICRIFSACNAILGWP
ncbi:16S rRNA methyltransferase [Sulfolobus tengchongensis]|uniref:Ribosomal RNA small subunit methyltransferase Nep1 n=1 Tax=Sulfolobus tengchongensis TaxID=207809 RepID=A0AAX4L3N3_9CREN